MRVLVVSTYELGHQPLSVATTTAALVAGGHQVRCADLAVATLSADDVDWAEGVALADCRCTRPVRLALPGSRHRAGPAPRPGPVLLFGLYAGMARGLTLSSPADAIVAGEFEPGVVAWAGGRDPGPVVQLGRFGGPGPRAGSAAPRAGPWLRSSPSPASCEPCSVRWPPAEAARTAVGTAPRPGRLRRAGSRPVAEDIVLADVDQLGGRRRPAISVSPTPTSSTPAHHAQSGPGRVA